MYGKVSRSRVGQFAGFIGLCACSDGIRVANYEIEAHWYVYAAQCDHASPVLRRTLRSRARDFTHRMCR